LPSGGWGDRYRDINGLHDPQFHDPLLQAAESDKEPLPVIGRERGGYLSMDPEAFEGEIMKGCIREVFPSGTIGMKIS